MPQSIATVVDGRDPDREHLAKPAAEWAGTVHELQIQLVVLAHYRRMDGVDLNDVVPVGDPLVRCQLLFGDVTNEGHA